MSEQPVDLTRRQVLLGALSTLIVGCSAEWRNIITAPQSASIHLRDALPNLVGDPAAAARLGQTYLAAHPEYRTADDLLNAIERTLLQHDAGALKQMDSDHVATAIKERIASEYAQNEVESVAGWIVSETEARLYGLTTMGVIDSRGQST